MIEIDLKEHFDIFVIGVGGTGSHLTSFLTQLLGNNPELKNKHSITLIDGDIVEEKNLRTQKFLSSDVGKSKAEVLADRYSAVYNMDIGYIDSYIESEDQLKKIAVTNTSRSIIVSCVDNNKARKIIDNVFNANTQRRYYYSSMIYIDTGNSSGEGELTGQTVIGYKKAGKTILPSVSTFFPQMLEIEEEEEIPQESCGEVMLKNIQNIGANITSACTVFNLLNSILSFGIIPANLFTFNASKIEAESMEIK